MIELTEQQNRQPTVEPEESAVAIYHVVFNHEDFSHAAQAVFKLIQEAQHVQPGKERKLFLDIEGHRNAQGGFDADMLELQKEFLMGFLIQFLSEIHGPLTSVKNPNTQNNEIPSELEIWDEGHNA
jgi:hypothetical protein